jgi:hypothetical protein
MLTSPPAFSSAPLPLALSAQGAAFAPPPTLTQLVTKPLSSPSESMATSWPVSTPVTASYASFSAMAPASFNNVPLPHTNEAGVSKLAETQATIATKEDLEAEKKKQARTPGLKAFDTLLYPLLTNFGVFAVSVLFTYLSTYGKPGSFFMKRGEQTRSAFKAMGFDKGSAQSAAMLTWSFLDGCIAAPMVKLFEDRRGQISKFFDKAMGTTPKDSSVYDNEPKQSWKTVLGGRFVASMSIVPVWNLMEQKWGGQHKLNERLFDMPGVKLAKKMETSLPAFTKAISKVIPADKLPKMMGVVLFESVYTAVTTAALYFASRAFARHEEKKQLQAAVSSPKVPTPAAALPALNPNYRFYYPAPASVNAFQAKPA